ncbi:hypothetical protein ACIQ1D_18305 [Lysinibacillus xylanilyticus]|uniref:hypothetical protein n=1 Tax=Lysinibacillus xylanilyticus TaxID=582475 RepID=UPI00382E767A
MTEEMLKMLKESKGEILIKAGGQVLLKVAGEEHLIEQIQIQREKEAYIFAEGLQLALGHFINYRPEIRMDA